MEIPMQGRLFSLFAFAAAVCALGSAPAQAQSRRFTPPPRADTFGAKSHTAELAEEMRRQANSICVELDRNYRQNPRYREVYRDAYQLITDAKHIQELIGNG